MMQTIKCGLIGATGYAGFHLSQLKVLRAKGEVSLEAVAIINQDEVPEICEDLKAEGCRVYPDYQSMLQEEGGKLDLCVVPTAIDWHRQMTVDALEAGCSVLVEKPLCAKVENAEAMLQAESRCPGFVAVGFQDFYAETTHEIKSLLCSGQLGKLKSIVASGLWPRTDAYYNRNNWAGKLHSSNGPVYDSPLNNALAHFLNLVLFWAGDTPEANGQIADVSAELYRTRDIETFDTATVRMNFSNDVSAWFLATHACDSTIAPVIRIEAENGVIEWLDASWWKLTDAKGQTKKFPLPDKVDLNFTIYRNICSRFSGKQARICDIPLAMDHVRLIEQLHDHIPVRQIDGRFIDTLSGGPDRQFAIRGISEDFSRATREKKLPSELGFDWASPATAFRLV